MKSLRAFMRALGTPRTIRTFEKIEKRFSFLTPSDKLIIGVLSVLMALGTGALLASVSLALTNTVPARGGTYTEGLVGSPRFINPLLAVSDTDRDLTALVYSGLLKSNPDNSLSLDLAERYSVSDDKRTYTFVLKDTAKFHNGKPVTADDVAFTVRSAENPDLKSPRRADWEGVTVEVIDPKTVTFTLKTPYAPFLENMTLGILPKSIWQGVSAEEFPFSTLNTSPIGSGPYKVTDVKRNNSGIPSEYRLSAISSGTRVPYIEKFVFNIYANEEDLQNALDQGAIDAAHSVDTKSILGAHTINEAVFGRVFGVFFNQSQNKIFADKEVRHALDVAVDKKALVSTVLQGHGSIIDGPLPPTAVDASEKDTRSKEQRREEAQAILAHDGWKTDANGLLSKTILNGKKKETVQLAFSLSTSNAPQLKRSAEMVAEDWRAIGAQVELKFFDQNDLNVSVIRPRKYDALLFGLVIGRDLDLFAFWHSSQRNDPGLNIGLYVNVALDKKLEALRTEDNAGRRLEKATAIARELEAETAAVFLYTPYFVYATPHRVEGMHFGAISTPSDRFNGVENWYLKSERVWPIFSH